MPSPPNLGGSESNFLPSLLQFILPVMDGMSSVLIIWSTCQSCVDALLMVRIYTLFYKQDFYKQHQTEIGKKISKN